MFCDSGTWTRTGLSGARGFSRFCASALGLDHMDAGLFRIMYQLIKRRETIKSATAVIEA